MELTIRDFAAGDEAAFRRLNEDWIVRHFGRMEEKDEEAVSDPQAHFLDGGGRIFFAVLDGETVGCCALRAMGPDEYEVAKMTVAESARGRGIGRRLLEHVVAEARATGAVRLYLETNRKLTTAIHLYESVGFRHLPAERFVPSPYARANVQMEMELGAHDSQARRPVPLARA